MILRVVSGGQRGADRAALEAAMELGLDRGGWAPKDWRAEDGQIPAQYRLGMREARSSHYPPRTELNVKDSDGTMILSLGELPRDSGSLLTAKIARKHGKPCRHFIIPPADQELSEFTRNMARIWLVENSIQVLNVAGPRESREPGVQLAVKRALVSILRS